MSPALTAGRRRRLRALPGRGRLLALAILLSAGCAAPGTASASCPSIDGLDEVLGRGRVVLLGEIHGTAEVPAFVQAMACRAVARDLSVVVALELPRDEQEAISAFMGSEGGAAGLEAIRSLPFWARESQDGRTSRAMLDLLEGLRDLRQRGGHAGVLLIDRPGEFSARDRAMAERLAAAAKAHPEALLVALTGNLHSRTDEGSGRMGELVEEALGPGRVLSLNMVHSGGTSWICEATAGCGPMKLKGKDEVESDGKGWRITLEPESAGPGHDGTFHVGSITASPPARGASASLEGGDR